MEAAAFSPPAAKAVGAYRRYGAGGLLAWLRPAILSFAFSYQSLGYDIDLMCLVQFRHGLLLYIRLKMVLTIQRVGDDVPPAVAALRGAADGQDFALVVIPDVDTKCLHGNIPPDGTIGSVL
jgi:hypothetical protein